MQLSALQALFDKSEDALAIVKRDQAIFDINPSFCRLLGYSRDHLIGRLITVVFANESDWQHLSIQRDVDFALLPWISVKVMHQSGHGIPVAARAITVPASDRGDDFVICMIRDVALATDASGTHVNSQVYNQDRLYRLTAGLAHDFNNVLAVISGNVQLAHLKSDRLSAEPFLRQAELGCAMAARMINQLLIISGTRRLAPELISIAEILKSMLAMLQGVAGGDVRIGLQFLHTLANIRVDRVGLENTLLNLVLNASEAMPAGGSIDIVVSQEFFPEAKQLAGGYIPVGRYLLISVKDTGVGMTQHIRQRAFDPYITTKLPSKFGDRVSPDASSAGCGLGLAQVHGFVTQSGGGVDLDSVMGQGTTVTVYLPMH